MESSLIVANQVPVAGSRARVSLGIFSTPDLFEGIRIVLGPEHPSSMMYVSEDNIAFLWGRESEREI